ncbi:MAG: DUF2782 domain-containing protein [Pseudomonadota bacterium]
MTRLLALFLAALLPWHLASAAEPAKTEPGKAPPSNWTVPPPPPPPNKDTPPPAEPPSAEMEPEITITTKGTELHEEYRLHGRLYMIKVTPAKGKPYYLIDQEGSGNFRRSDFDTRISIPMWVIKRF